MRLLAEKTRVIAEGAGGVAVAAALWKLGKEQAKGPIVAVVSGGNIDLATFCEVLHR
jgi:threonine dehydratase